MKRPSKQAVNQEIRKVQESINRLKKLAGICESHDVPNYAVDDPYDNYGGDKYQSIDEVQIGDEVTVNVGELHGFGGTISNMHPSGTVLVDVSVMGRVRKLKMPYTYLLKGGL